MRRLLMYLADLALVGAGTFAAFALRENLEVNPGRFLDFAPFLGITLSVALVLLVASGVTEAVWRFSSLRDYVRLVAVSCAIVAVSTILAFTYNRLDNIARAVPLLQALLIPLALVGARVSYRLHRAHRAGMNAFTIEPPSADEVVLVVGINPVTELFLTCVNTYTAQKIRVVGILAEQKHSTVGRTVYGVRVYGTVEQLDEVLAKLVVHGISIQRLVVTCDIKSLSVSARSAIRAVENSSDIKVDYFADRLGFSSNRDETKVAAVASTAAAASAGAAASVFKVDAMGAAGSGVFWRVKRAFDICIASVLLLAFLPAFFLVALLVAIDVGGPVLFWQYRPGLGWRKFKLYKFRTMAAAHDELGKRVPDDQRLSRIGWLLRRTRLDELPQLFNVLKGDMSFVGPRPLLLIEQSDAPAARLLVRPGLTGWAQVNGGRNISTTDKIALDLWYITHASVKLDLTVFCRTVPMLFRGERTNPEAVAKAWHEFSNAPVVAAE